MWDVDPETKSKLLALQKNAPNAICADCSSPSPQWASPKFGTFICLDCAGAHRGLGVHISFVRSVMMDSFKVSEVRRMEEGGNSAWREFWDNHPEGGGKSAKGTWNGVVAERYEGPVGEEYKERLACKVEGREFVPLPKKEKKQSAAVAAGGPATSTQIGGRGSPAPRSASPALSGSRKERNESYFARKGAENAGRPDDLLPSQGGKYGGFGSGFAPEGPSRGVGGQGIPGVDEFQNDPMAAISKGFGWFTSTVGKGAKSMNDGFIQPNMQKLAESDLAAQAKIAAANVAQNVQKGAHGAASSVNNQFQRFVEGSDSEKPTSTVEPERRDFWDSFGGSSPTTATPIIPNSGTSAKKGSAIGTSAMKSSGSSVSGEGEGKDGWGTDW